MNAIQMVIALLGFVSVLAAIIAGAWINQRSIARQMEAFRNEVKAELRAAIDPLRAEMRAEMRALNEKVDRIDQTFQRLYQPVVPPGRGD